VILGKQWKTEDADIKDQYKAIADMLKRKHAQDHPDYQYNPRKPSEKKKRMTARKAAELVNPEVALAGPSAQMSASSIATSGYGVTNTGASLTFAAPSAAMSRAIPNAGAAAPMVPIVSNPSDNASNVTLATTVTSSMGDTGSATAQGLGVNVEGSDNDDDAEVEEIAANVALTPDLPSTPVFMEYENGNLGFAIPMNDHDLAKLLKDHNDFLEANPNLVEPLTADAFQLEYSTATANDANSLDSLVNWDQILDDYTHNFADDSDEFSVFFQDELQRLTSDE